MKPVAHPNVPKLAHLLPWEDQSAYAARLDELVLAYAPLGPIERAAVERIALLLQRRDRIMLAERACHLMGLHEAADTSYRVRWLARRAGHHPGNITAHEHVYAVLDLSEADDATDRAELAHFRAETARARAILEAGGPDAYEQAVAAFDPETVECWESWIGSAPDEETWIGKAAAKDAPVYAATAESLLSWIVDNHTPYQENVEEGINARPALRLQAMGESLQPDKMERLHALDSRLDRDLERAVAMLIRLQELRAGDVTPRLGDAEIIGASETATAPRRVRVVKGGRKD
jgi:hypothetical protein